MIDPTRFPKAFALPLVLAALVGACAEAGEEDAEVQIEETGAPATQESAAAPTAGADELVNPNVATRDDLMALPGMDASTVTLLIQQRPFEGMMDLHSTLSARMDSVALDQLYREMFIPLDIETASEEEMLLIPGAGPRMVHEFEEYRPYEGGVAEFRQEIGKYVDEEEVARFERYFLIR